MPGIISVKICINIETIINMFWYMHFVNLKHNNPTLYKYNFFSVNNFDQRKIGFVCVIRDEQVINLILYEYLEHHLKHLNHYLHKEKLRSYTV